MWVNTVQVAALDEKCRQLSCPCLGCVSAVPEKPTIGAGGMASRVSERVHTLVRVGRSFTVHQPPTRDSGVSATCSLLIEYEAFISPFLFCHHGCIPTSVLQFVLHPPLHLHSVSLSVYPSVCSALPSGPTVKSLSAHPAHFILHPFATLSCSLPLPLLSPSCPSCPLPQS